MGSAMLSVLLAIVVAPSDAVQTRRGNWPFESVQPVSLPKPIQPVFQYTARQPAGTTLQDQASKLTHPNDQVKQGHALYHQQVDVASFAPVSSVPVASLPGPDLPPVASVPVTSFSSFVASVPLPISTSLPVAGLPPYDPTSSLPYDLGWLPGPAEQKLKDQLGEDTVEDTASASVRAASAPRRKRPAAAAAAAGRNAPIETQVQVPSHTTTFMPEGITDAQGVLTPSNVANRHLLANMSGALIVVSHHKSGTVASQDLIVSRCCPEAQHATPSAKFYRYFAGPSGCAYKACAEQNVAYARVGYRGTEPPPADSMTIHFMRDPSSMVVSGYLYHLACNEPSWTDAHFPSSELPNWMSLRFGSNESFVRILASLGETPQSWDIAKATYCALLRTKTVKEGLKAEALRSTLAADGLGMMLVDRRTLSRHQGKLLEVCLEDATPGNPAYDATWEAISAVAGVRKLLRSPNWYAEHSTTSDGARGTSRAFMLHYAQELLKDVLPRELRAEQPCVMSHPASHARTVGMRVSSSADGFSPRILAAVSSACGLSSEKGRQVIVGIAAQCARTPSLSVILNVFDAPLPEEMKFNYKAQAQMVTGRSLSEICAVPAATLPPCVRGVTRVRGFKMLFFKHAITPDVSEAYDYVWTVDNDIGVNPQWPFDLLSATRAMAASRVAIAQPIVKSEASLYRAAKVRRSMRAQAQRAKAHSTSAQRVTSTTASSNGRSSEAAAKTDSTSAASTKVRGAVQLSGGDFAQLSQHTLQGCAAQQVTWVESQTPLFSRDAWAILYDKVLSQLDEEVYLGTDQGPSSFWCHMMALELPDRPSCAVLDVPVVDSSFKTIRDVHRLSTEHDVIAYMKAKFPQYTGICSELDKAGCLSMLHAAPRGHCLVENGEVATRLAAASS